MTRRLAGPLAVLAIVAAACGPLTPTVATPPAGSPLAEKGPLMAAFDQSLAKWQAAGITRYAFTYQPQCFCDTWPRLVVSDGDGIRIDGVPAGPGGSTPAGVPGLFAFARNAINGDSATIEYDPTTGVPVHVVSDPMRHAIDDELTFSVVDWTLEPPDDRTIGAVSQARARWSAARILDYSMTVTIGRDVYRVGVRDGSPTVRKNGRRFDPADHPETPIDVWPLLQAAADWARTGTATVTLDERLGYPKRIEVQPSPAGGVGETITVSDFEVN
jgi:hypothetical protein